MTSSRFFRLLVMSALVSLVMGAIHSLPALAAESLRVSPTKGAIGAEIDVSGSGYDPGDRVYIHFSSRKASEGDDIDELVVWEEVRRTTAGEQGTTDEGDIDTSFRVPSELNDGDETDEVRAGKYFVYTTYSSRGKIQAVDEFRVTGITMVYPARCTVGAEVVIKGVGFNINEDIEVFYDGDEVEITSGDSETDKKGDFTLTLIVPPSTMGTQNITVEIDKEKSGAEITVEPGVSVDITSGIVGDRVTVTGTGFGKEVGVLVTFGGKEVGTAATDDEGSFAINFDIPSVGPGTYDVEAKDENDNSARTEFTSTTDISISPATSVDSPGNVGMEVTISGTGFRPKTTVTITYATSPVVVAVTESKANGSFSATFKVPKSEAGEHTITASDGTRTLGITFFMESTPPTMPVLLLPAMEAKPQQPVRFDWGDVTDPSGVVYTLQIARDKNFTYIVLEKEGLSQSEYTMTGEEQLESTKKEEPYWWRVSAIDLASNKSGWSVARSFIVGSVITIPDWTKYLLGVLGGLLLFLLGFLLVRRRGKAT